MSLLELAQDALGDAETLTGVGVVGADFDAGQLADGDVLGGVMKEDEVDGVAGDTGCG